MLPDGCLGPIRCGIVQVPEAGISDQELLKGGPGVEPTLGQYDPVEAKELD